MVFHVVNYEPSSNPTFPICNITDLIGRLQKMAHWFYVNTNTLLIELDKSQDLQRYPIGYMAIKNLRYGNTAVICPCIDYFYWK
jgi:hypothetical protein